MCVGSPDYEVAEVETVAEAATAPETATSGSTVTSEDEDEARRAVASGTSERSTILTSSRGVTESAGTQNKTLLGQ